MLYIIIAAIALICVIAFFAGKKTGKNTKKYIVYIEGMMCGHCKAHVEKAFKDAGFSVKVDLENKFAEVLSDKDVLEEDLKAIIEKAGYTFVKCE